jgi:hypothetical protein
MKLSGPGFVLRLEDVALLIGGVLLYAKLDARWGLFALLFLVPDLFMAGYAVNKTVGAVVYNIGHTYASPVLLAGIGYVVTPALYPIAIIWAAHISFDRMIGYGLKYAEGFKSTHLGRI